MRSTVYSIGVTLGDVWCWPKASVPSLPGARPLLEVQQSQLGSPAISLDFKRDFRSFGRTFSGQSSAVITFYTYPEQPPTPTTTTTASVLEPRDIENARTSGHFSTSMVGTLIMPAGPLGHHWSQAGHSPALRPISGSHAPAPYKPARYR